MSMHGGQPHDSLFHRFNSIYPALFLAQIFDRPLLPQSPSSFSACVTVWETFTSLLQ